MCKSVSSDPLYYDLSGFHIIKRYLTETFFCYQSKKFIFAFVIMSLFTGMFLFAAPQTVDAQTYVKRVVRNGRVSYVRVKKPSFYAELIWDLRKVRAQSDGASVDWVVLRNRLQHIEANNMRRVGKAICPRHG